MGVHTLNGEPQSLSMWVDTAREEIDPIWWRSSPHIPIPDNRVQI